MELYGFSKIQESSVEFIFSDEGIIGYYIYFAREDYPVNVRFKFSKSSDLLEYFPIYLDNVEDSIKVFKGEKPYKLEEYSKLVKNYKYFNFIDTTTPISYLYNGNDGNIIHKNLPNGTDAGSIIYIDKFEICNVIPHIKNFPNSNNDLILKYQPDYIMVELDKEKTFKELMICFNSDNPLLKDFCNENSIKLI